jgi:hypothetical protein
MPKANFALATMTTMIENSETSGRNGADESDSGGADEENGESETDEPIANKESKDVFRLRAIAGVVLVCAAIGVAATLCTYIIGNEESKFTQQFENDSFKVFEAIGSRYVM